MVEGFYRVAVLLLTVITIVSGYDDCLAYQDGFNIKHQYKSCTWYCCGTCTNRYCCSESLFKISEETQKYCAQTYETMDSVYLGSSIAGVIILVSLFLLCCLCPCCCLYKMCRKPQPVIATHTTTTVINTPYPQQPSALPPQAPQTYQYAGYQPVPIQPGYGPPAGPQQYYGPPMLQAPYQGQACMPGPPPPYHEAAAASYPAAPMPYSQAAFSPGQQTYPLQPPAQTQTQPQPHAQPDYLNQPAYNPAYADAPPAKTGY